MEEPIDEMSEQIAMTRLQEEGPRSKERKKILTLDFSFVLLHAPTIFVSITHSSLSHRWYTHSIMASNHQHAAPTPS